jgi:hypothetical protein
MRGTSGMSEDGLRQRYKQAVGDTSNSEELLRTAYENRNFEIELYWRRAGYFWAFQAVALGAIGLVVRENEASLDVVALLTILGFLTALLGCLSAKGSKFWQESWEAHVDHLELLRSAQLAQVIVVREPPSYSVTKLNLRFMKLLAAAWLIASLATFALLASPELELFRDGFAPWRVALYAAFLAGATWFLLGSRTNLSGWEYLHGADDWTRLSRRKDKIARVILRDVVGFNQEKPPRDAD